MKCLLHVTSVRVLMINIISVGVLILIYVINKYNGIINTIVNAFYIEMHVCLQSDFTR